MGGLTVNLRFFITMYELSSLNLMNCTCYVVISPSILCTLWKPGSMTLCWTHYLQLLSWWWGFLHIRDLSHNAMLMENMELLLHNGSSNHLCVCALYSLPSNTHLVLQCTTAIDFMQKVDLSF